MATPRTHTRYLTAISTLFLLGGILTTAAPSPIWADPSVDDQISKAGHDLEVIVEQYNKTAEELSAVNARAKTVKSALGPLRQAIEANDADISTIAVYYYKTGGLSATNALLSGDPMSLADRMTTLDFIAWRQSTDLRALLDTRTSLENEQGQIQALRAEKKRLEKELMQKKADVEAELARLYQLRNGATPSEGSRYTLHSAPRGKGNAAAALRFANDTLGTPYQWGGSSPGGYDCSGLTSAAWAAAGKALPHNASMQYDAVQKIDKSALKPGDLVFYYNDIHHVGIYAGEGMIIHAPEEGQGVRVSPVDSMPVYGYGRP